MKKRSAALVLAVLLLALVPLASADHGGSQHGLDFYNGDYYTLCDDGSLGDAHNATLCAITEWPIDEGTMDFWIYRNWTNADNDPNYKYIFVGYRGHAFWNPHQIWYRFSTAKWYFRTERSDVVVNVIFDRDEIPYATWTQVRWTWSVTGNYSEVYTDGTLAGFKNGTLAYTSTIKYIAFYLAENTDDYLLDELWVRNASISGNYSKPTAEFSTDGDTVLLHHLNEGIEQYGEDSSPNNWDGRLGLTTGVEASDPTWIGAEEIGMSGLIWGSPTSPINELENFTITLTNDTSGFPGMNPWWFTLGAPPDDAWWNIYDENDIRWLYAANQTYSSSYEHIGLDSGLHTLYGYSNDTGGTEFTDTLALTVRDPEPGLMVALIAGIVLVFGVIAVVAMKKR